MFSQNPCSWSHNDTDMSNLHKKGAPQRRNVRLNLIDTFSYVGIYRISFTRTSIMFIMTLKNMVLIFALQNWEEDLLNCYKNNLVITLFENKYLDFHWNILNMLCIAWFNQLFAVLKTAYWIRNVKIPSKSPDY